MSSGSLPLPHFGDWTQEGTPTSHSQAAIASRVASSHCLAGGEATFREPRPTRVAVVDEDRRRVPVSGCSAVDTPPMSHRSQVATSGSRPIEACSAACAAPGSSAALDAGSAQHVVGHRPPDRLGAQLADRQVQRLLADHLARPEPASQVGHHLVADVDRAEGQRHAVDSGSPAPPRRPRSRSGRGRASSSRASPPRPARRESSRSSGRPGRSRPGAGTPRRHARRREPRSRRPSRAAARSRPHRCRSGRRPSPGCRRDQWPDPGGSSTSPRPPAEQPGRHQLVEHGRRVVGPNSRRSASVSGISAAAAAGAGRGRTGCPGRAPPPRPAARTPPRGGAPDRCPAGRPGRSDGDRVAAGAPGPAGLLPHRGRLPGQPAISTASSPLTSTPSSRALVVASPSSRPLCSARSRARRSSAR